MSLYLGNDLISGNKPINLGVRNIGEIVASPLPLTDAGLHLLDGSLIQGSGIYQGFVDYIADLYTENPSASYWTTEALWQQSVTTYGVCGKFVYDSISNTVRLPKVTGIIEGTTDLTALGDLVEESLPNHTHNYTDYYAGFDQGHGGSLPLVSSYNTSTIRTSEGSNNSVYKDNAHVQPQTIKVLYYIVVATSSKTDIQVDIDEIATDLNGKADVDLSNCTKPHIVETYVNGTSWYRVYSDGWCEQGSTSGNSGRKQISLLKNYANTNYNVLGCCLTSTSSGNNGAWFTCDSKATSSFYVRFGYGAGDVSSNGNYTYVWQASGYIS